MIQNCYEGNWWEQLKSDKYERGELIWCFIPFINLVPVTLETTGRNSPSDHYTAHYKLANLSVNYCYKPTSLPVAGMPTFKDEVKCVYRAKKRPALILSTGGKEISKDLNKNKPNRITSQYLIVAPYYGNEQNETKGGHFSENLRNLAVKAIYPQSFVEFLPFEKKPTESILRFDHCISIGSHHDSIQRTGIVLTKGALEIIDQWFEWFISNIEPTNNMLQLFKDECSFLESV
jgi:hypothetical protein